MGGRKLGGIRDWKSKVVGEPGTMNLELGGGDWKGKAEAATRANSSSPVHNVLVLVHNVHTKAVVRSRSSVISKACKFYAQERLAREKKS